MRVCGSAWVLLRAKRDTLHIQLKYIFHVVVAAIFFFVFPSARNEYLCAARVFFFSTDFDLIQ